MARIVVYGGTFNPIHKGHTALIEGLMRSGDYDRFLLVPAASPPHKDAPILAAGSHRLELCRIATAHLPQVEVLPWEIERGGKSYTVDTLHHLRELYPEDELFLLIGVDMFLTFTDWRDWQTIAQWAVLLVANRASGENGPIARQQKKLQAMGVRAVLLHNSIVEGSSTRVRRDMAAYDCSNLLDKRVEQYCKENGLYTEKYDLEQLRRQVKPLVSEKRFHHILCVEQRAVELARRYGADLNRAAAAAILHDVCKNMQDEVLLHIITSCDTITDIDFVEQPELLHSRAGALWLEREWGIRNADVLNAVRYHTTGRAGMSRLEKIIYLADLTSSERNYPDVQLLRNLVDRSLDEGMLYALKYIVEEHLPRLERPICADTRAAFDECSAIAMKKGSGNAANG